MQAACSECADGLVRTQGYECGACPDAALSLVLVLGGSLAALLTMFFIIGRKLKSAILFCLCLANSSSSPGPSRLGVA